MRKRRTGVDMGGEELVINCLMRTTKKMVKKGQLDDTIKIKEETYLRSPYFKYLIQFFFFSLLLF